MLSPSKHRRSATSLEFIICCLVVTLTTICPGCDGQSKYHYQTKEFEVPVDHFDFANVNATFKLRYLFNDSYVDKQAGVSPLFFYTGNEGDVETFAQNTGFMWELARKSRASVVFAEHRYYGKSLPFGNNTFNNTRNYGFLTVEQALEDYAWLIESLKEEHNYGPVIAFGGSYGGMLAAWIRMKYPHLVYGALAASAPVRQFDGITPCDIFSKIVTSIFSNAFQNANCTTNIKNSWNLFKQLAASEEGKKKLNAAFNFCKNIEGPKDLDKFLDYMEDLYGSLAMVNYPYENDFLSPLPPYPVRQFCSYLQKVESDDKLLNAMKQAVEVYANFTGTTTCLNYDSAFVPSSIGGDAWDIQTCNQMVMPMCNTPDTMFRHKDWNFEEYSKNCISRFSLKPKLHDITLRYGNGDMRDATNIIFSNGLLDPWSGGGVLMSHNRDIYVVIIPEGAHHLDLRAANPKDPASVQQAREREAMIIEKWISQYHF